MHLPKLFFGISCVLFGSIGLLAVMKKEVSQRQIQRDVERTLTCLVDTQPTKNLESPLQNKTSVESSTCLPTTQQIDIAYLQPPEQKNAVFHAQASKIASTISDYDIDIPPLTVDKAELAKDAQLGSTATSSLNMRSAMQTPNTTHSSAIVIEHENNHSSTSKSLDSSLHVLFEKPSRCPIVETIRYTSRVAWKPKKAAWLIDYAHYYKTPLDFIYKSIQSSAASSGKVQPTQAVEGMTFNVFRRDIDFYFYLIVSFSSCQMRVYYILPAEKKAVFLTSYPICLGRKDASQTSGSLTPFGLYQLGLNVMKYQPHVMGSYKGKKVEMVQIFGTCWMPFERAVDQATCTSPAKGYGIHGTPLKRNIDNGVLTEDSSSIGKFESDGCIRLNTKNVEELYSIISMRKAYIEITSDFSQSRLMKGEI